MFEKSLQDLVKGIRSHKRDPSAFISQSIQEIKQELKSVDPFVKAQAVRKLTYLQMMGYDMSWAAFAVVEVMSSQRFAHKRIGYLAACQTFTEATDVILLTTNLLKKEFQSPNQYEVGLAVNCLANIVTRDLARDLVGDVVALIGHSKPYVRKKSVLSLYKLYVKYPQGLRLTFDKLKEKLDDPESAVVSCAVNVICELANKNPKNYLALAPKFFRLLTTSSNNWMLIKVVKLLGSLVPEEPRLARKLLEPLATIIQNTAAKSLLYECIHTVTLALPFARKPATDTAAAAAAAAAEGAGKGGGGRDHLQAVVSLCAEHLRQFVEDPDQNLKYLGLVGFVNLMKSYPKAVMEHKELVLRCLADDDVTIRTKALELLTGMVTRRNLTELVHKLMQHALLAEGAYRDEIIAKIVFMCSRDKYAYLSDVPWYVSILVDLAYVQGPVHGPLVAAQLIDVAVRAAAVRGYAVRCMLGLLLDASGLFLGQSQATMAHVLFAAGWIVGEYAEQLPAQAGAEEEGGGGAAEDAVLDASQLSTLSHAAPPQGWPATPAAVFRRVMEAYLDPRATNLPEEVQVVYMQNALKALAAAARLLGEDADLAGVLGVLRGPGGGGGGGGDGGRLLVFLQSVHIEVQERAATLRNLLTALGVLPALPAPSSVAAATGPGAAAAVGAESEGEEEKSAEGAKEAMADLLGAGGNGGDGDDGGGGDLMLLDGGGGGGGSDALDVFGSDTTAAAAAGSQDAGVRALRLHQGLLAALFAEELAPVNPRAQRKVPVPEGLDLEAPLDAKALGELESYRGGFPRDPDLSRVCFTQVYVEPVEADGFEGSEGGPSPLGTPGRLGGYEEAFGVDSPKDKDSRRRWQATPFYLSSNAAAGAGAGGGPEDGGGGMGAMPPEAMLTAADLDGGRGAGRRRGKGGKKERRKHRRRRTGNEEEDEEEEEEGQQQQGGYRPRYAGAMMGAGGGGGVLRDEVMPAGAVDSGSEDGEGGRKGQRRGGGGGCGGGDEDAVDLKDIDITTPLRPDEVMPRMEHRAAPPTGVAAAASAAMGAATGKDERRRHRRKESSSRRRGKERGGGGNGGGGGGGDLIDFADFGGGGGGAGGGEPVSSATLRRDSADTRRIQADAMDLLMFGDSAAASPPRPSSTAVGGGGADDVLGLGLGLGASPPKERKRRKGDKAHRRKGSGAAAPAEASAAAVPAPAPPAAAATNAASLLDAMGEHGAAAGAAGSSLRALRFPLAKTGGVKVEYSLAASGSDGGRLAVHVRAKKAAAQGPVAGLRLRLLPPFPAGVSPEETTVPLTAKGGPLTVGASAKASVVLRLGPEARGKSLAVPIKLEFGGSGSGGGGGGADLLGGGASAGAAVAKDCKLLLPASVALRPGGLSPHAFMSLLSGANREVAWHERSVRLSRGKKGGGDFDAAVSQVAAFFQAQTVEKTPPAAAALYATTAVGEHVAVLVKFSGGSGAGVLLSVKASSEALAEALVADAQALLCTL